MIADTIKCYTSAYLTRYHCRPEAMQQSVAAHTWGVVFLLMQFHEGPSSSLIKAALFHDLGEMFGPGDVSAIAKARYPELATTAAFVEDETLFALGLPVIDLGANDILWLRWADTMEAALHAHRLWTECGYPVARQILSEALHHLPRLTDATDALAAKLRAAL